MTTLSAAPRPAWQSTVRVIASILSAVERFLDARAAAFAERGWV